MNPVMERNRVLDAAKYILIVLVVIGHFIEPTKYTSSTTCALYCLIYSFHMPLFVLISGYFYKQRSITEEIKKCIPFLEVCLLSHIGFLLIQNGLDISIKKTLFFSGPSWYLLCLVYWRLGTNLLFRYLNVKTVLLFAIICDFLCFNFVEYGSLFSIARAISFYPFFILGYCLKDKLQEIIVRYKLIFLVIGMISIVFVVITASVLQFKIEFQLMNVFNLKEFTDMNVFAIFGYRYLLILCALSIGGLVLVLINSSKELQKLSVFGKTTLFIYFIQTFAFAFIGSCDLLLWQSLIIAFASIPVFTYLGQQKFASYIMTPISHVMHIVK